MDFYLGKGLSSFRNLGNTCYLNSSLHAMANCLVLTRYLLSGDFKKNLGPLNFERRQEFSFLISYVETLSAYYDKNRIIIPKSIHYKLINLTELETGEQEDAYLCILSIIDILKVALNIPDKESFISKLFSGRYNQSVKCKYCSHSSTTKQDFTGINLNLDIDDGILSIYSLMDSYFKDCKIEKECEKCSKIAIHDMNIKIWKIPRYLIVHLKRFDSRNRKIKNTVAFSSDLDLSDYCSGKENSNYELVSVINHTGSTRNGHYYTYNRTYDGKWVYLDDEKASFISPTDVCTDKAYILVYEKN